MRYVPIVLIVMCFFICTALLSSIRDSIVKFSFGHCAIGHDKIRRQSMDSQVPTHLRDVT